MNLKWFVDQLNITTVIAVAGFCLSICNAISAWAAKRKRLRFAVYFARGAMDTAYFKFGVENLSQLPIAISRVEINIRGSWFDCTPLPTMVEQHIRRSGKTVLSEETIYSSALPFDIGPLGAFKGTLLFECLPALPKKSDKAVTFRVSTNRGRAIEISVPLLSGWDFHDGNK